MIDRIKRLELGINNLPLFAQLSFSIPIHLFYTMD